MSRMIDGTQVQAVQPWPQEVDLWGSRQGSVRELDPDPGDGPVRPPTGRRAAVVNVSAAGPPGDGPMLVGYGDTVAAAELAVWHMFQAMVTCSGHGPYDPGGYDNGCGFCIGCGTWFAAVLPETGSER